MRWLVLCLALIWPAMGFGQQDDRGRLQAFLEDSLSDAGRVVRIQGFAGALSARATLDELSIADDVGIWLTLRDVVLSWNRAALLRGRLEVEELSAGALILPRLPAREDAGPQPEASGFDGITLPELPVAISIGRLAIERAEIGAPLLGQAAVFQLGGRAALAEGAGEAALELRRIDGRVGDFALDAALSNLTGALRVNLSLEEGAGGIAAGLIGLPGTPPVALRIEGDGSVTDFTAQIALDTDGAPRVSGSAAWSGRDERQLSLDLGGDIRPLLPAQHHMFFGDRTALTLTSVLREDGGVTLEDLRATAEAIDLSGSLAVGADGWPEAFDLNVSLTAVGGETITLPGSDLSTQGAEIEVAFDAARADTWRAQAVLRAAAVPGLEVGTAQLSGTGTIRRGTQRTLGTASGDLTLDLAGVRFDDPVLSNAVGDTLVGQLGFGYAQDSPLTLRDIAVEAAGSRLTGAVDIAGLMQGLNPVLEGQLGLELPDLARWSELIGQDLSGSAILTVAGNGAPLAGTFEVDLSGDTRDLATGIDALDPLLAGAGSVRATLTRSQSGTFLSPSRIATQQADITVQGALRTGGSTLDLTLALPDVGLAVPGLVGALTASGTARQSGETWQVAADLTAPGDSRARLDLTTDIGAQVGPVRATADLRLGRLDAFAALAGVDLQGGAALRVSGQFDPATAGFSLEASGTTRALGLGIASADQLLAGTGTITAALSGTPEQIDVTRLDIATDHVTLQASGTTDTAQNASVAYRVALRDLAVLVADLPGALSATGRLHLEPGVLRVTSDVTAPGETTGQITARLSLDDSFKPGTVEGEVQLNTARLGAFSRLSGQRMGGGVRVDLTGRGDVSDLSFAMQAEAVGTALSIGQAEADLLLRGQTSATLRVISPEHGRYRLEQLDLRNDQLRAAMAGGFGPNETSATYDVTLRNLGIFVAQLPGAVSAQGTIARTTGPWRISSSLQGPAGTTVQADGTLSQTADRGDLSLSGTAPLALANRFTAPNLAAGLARFDLTLRGPLALSSLRGTVQSREASLTLPGQPIGLRNIQAAATLADGRANLDVSADVAPGGRMTLRGPVSLTAPNNAELTIALDTLNITQPGLLETTASGQVSVTGPLQGAARIAGQIVLGPVEVRLAEPLSSAAAGLDGLEHVGAPAAVRITQQRAGLQQAKNGDAKKTSGPAYPLDLTIRAPSQIFVRGRGLDAELGGALSLQGTTNAVAPVGRFDLIRGRMDILGQRVTLKEGYAQMRGGMDPFVRMIAETQSGDVLVQILVEGLASAPEITLSSVPELPQDEVMAQLLFGRDLSEITPFQALRLASAVATLLGRGGDGIVFRLREGFGLDDLDIIQNDDGTTGVRAGKYLSENVYSDVTTSSSGDTEINLNLDLSPNLTLRGSAGSDGDTGLGIFFEKDY